MKKKFILSIFLLWFAGISVAQVVEVVRSDEVRTVDGKQYYIHYVEPGQTLYSISKAYKIPMDEIRFENPELKDGLKAFMEIKIPVRSRDVAIAEKIREGGFDFMFHIARNGQTFNDIALIYSVPEELIKSANPDIIDRPKEGQYIRIPILKDKNEAFTDENVVMHKIEPGETFYSLSKKYNISVEEIKKANEGVSYPKAGNQILIPVVSEDEKKKSALHVFEYKVNPGETLYGIARRFQTSIDSIRSYNFGLVDDINAGQILNIPYRPGEKEYIVHRVDERKVSLKKLARKYDVEPDEVKDLNPRLDNRVSFNQSVKIPVDEEAYVPVELDLKEVEAKEDEIDVSNRPEPCIARVTIDRSYKVALMLPLYLEEVEYSEAGVLDDPNIVKSYLPFQFIQFYQGFLLAAESLKEQGLDVEIHVYDVDQQISKTIKVLQRDEMKDMDLIVGPLFRTSFKYVSNFAELFNIRIVNPLSRSDEVLMGTRNVFKVMPSEDAQPGILKQMVTEDFKNHRVILVRHSTYQDEEKTLVIRNLIREAQTPEFSMNNALLEDIIEELGRKSTGGKRDSTFVEIPIEGQKVYTDLVSATPANYTEFPNDVPEIVFMNDSLTGIERATSVIRPNLVIAMADNEVFAIELMTALNELKDSIDMTLVGIPDWYSFNNLDPEYLMAFQTHMLAPEYVDYDRGEVREFVRHFRERYKAEPENYAFDGFDIGLYFLSAVMTYGPDFDGCLDYVNPDLLQGKYKFVNIPGGGFENRHWNVIRYGRYRIEQITLPESEPEIEIEEL